MSDRPTAPPQPTLAILAGGEGARMGEPKANLLIGGQPILAYLLDRLRWPGRTLLVTAPGREHPPACERFDRELVDPTPGLGPLRGVLTVLEHLEPTEIALITTVDMPAIRPEMLDWILQQFQALPAALGLMTRHPSGADHIIEPFPFALRAEARSLVADQLQCGRRSVWSLSKHPEFIVLDAPAHWPAEVWTNLNDPADLTNFTASLPFATDNGPRTTDE
ncbi:MAG TPA: molybdenum cofactor guanylyltransferase [Tepidisphaeraceae bacterium]|jgi:molybdopterin-guanine dinucleotide biosynthesis protein A